MKFHLVTWMLVLCGLTHAALLDSAGQPYRAIVVAPEAPDSVQLAARELQGFLKQVGVADLPVTPTADAKPVIYVGEHPELAGLAGELAELPSDGFLIRTVPDALVIAGRDYAGPPLMGWRNPWRDVELYHYELKLAALGEQGTLYGVYHFLEQFGGVRFYWPGELGTVVPEIAELQLPEIDLTRAPRFHYRYPWYSFLKNDRDGALWMHRVGFGGKAPVMIIHSYDLINRYKETHPEYFALADGKRAFGSECVADGHGHQCLTNPALIQQWVDDISDYFDKNPEVEVFPLAPNDGLNRICECPSCQAEDRPDAGGSGRFSYHIWNFTNQVARGVAQRHPDKFVGCLAYERYRDYPEGLKLEPNVAVMFCNWRSLLGNEETRTQLHQQLDRWSQEASRLYFWTWYLDHWPPTNQLPVLFSRTIGREIAWMAANPKFFGEFIESENPSGKFDFGYDRIGTPGMQHLNLYLTGKLYWEPDASPEALLAEYFALFYGPAEAPMRRFWTRAEEQREAVLAQNANPAPDQIFSGELLQELRSCLEEAKSAAPPDSVYAKRIALVADEFEAGAGRLTRILQKGQSRLTLEPIVNPAELDTLLPMRFYTLSAEAADPNTFVYAAYDRQYLYWRFLCYEPEMKSLAAKCTEHDQDGIWEDDSIEILICPDPENTALCYQWIINSNGVCFDGRKISAAACDTKWESDAQIQVRREANRWIVDLRVPWAALGVNDPNFTANPVANFYRNRRAGGKNQAFAWSPTGAQAFFVPESFGVLELKK